ncbi:putative transcription elongation factor B polypeptide 3 isoform X1 [Apostichopus japonicus]|uniref:Putative transcription elongation factor B polypeptide 3 isoform X1 n=1 Tax=Stichopus japonicus TaxID=307972 RepID=A0A2G8JW60_STIJA|nr:putative transcription elongation factor B polypeptide 3 isoform X1 [Apostichopus japonicus]
MASHHDVVQRVLSLKSKLSNNPLPETSKVIRLLEKLSRLPVNVEVLQETRIGKCVNGLKKKCPEVAVYVKPLISSWKSLGPPRGRGLTLERHDKSPVRKDFPLTPIPWSPEKKIFPPFVPRKERQKEKDGRKEINLIHGDGDFKDKKKRERGINDSDRSLAKSRSDPKGTSKTLSSKSRELFEDSSSPTDEPSINKSHNSESYLVGRSNHGIKRRTEDLGKDKPKVKSRSETSSHPKKVVSKSNVFNDDNSSLFQPDTHNSERKSSKQVREVSPVSGQNRKRQAMPSEAKVRKILEEEEDIYESQQVSKKPIEHKKKVPSLGGSDLDGKSSKVSSKTASKKVSSPGTEKVKSQTSRNKPTTKVPNRNHDLPDPSDDSRLDDVGEGKVEITYENTGLSFEDCLFGGGSPPVIKKPKKVTVTSGGKHSKERQRPAKQDGQTSTGERSVSEKRRRDRSEESASRRATKEELGGDVKPKKRKPTDQSGSSRNSEKRPPKESKQIESEVREASESEIDMSLPDIRPDYKPASRLPELKPSERRKTSDTNLAMQWGSKQTKTKVYSGKARKRHWNSLPSLQEICKEVIFDNIEALYDTGGVPFYIMEDILEKCNAQQLLKIEDYNPSYILESDHLWKRHAERTFKGAEQEEMESWRELYLRKNDEREYKLLAITANISASMAKKETGRLTKLAFVDRPVKPPRNVIRQQIRHGTSSSSLPHKAPQPRRDVIPGEEPSHRIIPDREPSSPVKRQRIISAKVYRSFSVTIFFSCQGGSADDAEDLEDDETSQQAEIDGDIQLLST